MALFVTCRTTRALVAISPSWSGLVKAMPTPTPAMRIMTNIINVTLVIIKAMSTPIPAMRIMINIINVRHPHVQNNSNSPIGDTAQKTVMYRIATKGFS